MGQIFPRPWGSRVSYHIQAVDGFTWPNHRRIKPTSPRARAKSVPRTGPRAANGPLLPSNGPLQTLGSLAVLSQRRAGDPPLFNFLRMKCPHNGPSPLLISPLSQLFHCLPWIARTHRSSHPVAPSRLSARRSRLLALPNNGRRARRPQTCSREITGMKPQYV